MLLNLGCGQDYRDGWTNVDIDENSPADLVYDLQDVPWPWNDETVKYILMDNVFEHIHPRYRTAVIRECHRILHPSGHLQMHLPVPEVGGGWDETHYVVPGWRWPYNPKWRDMWTVTEVESSRVGVGQILPDSLSRLLTRFWVVRCVDEVRIKVVPR